MDLFEQKFVELNYTDNRPSHNGDAAKECEKLIRAEGCQVMFDRAPEMPMICSFGGF